MMTTERPVSELSAGVKRAVDDGRGRFGTVREFLSTEAGGAVVLLAATIVALIWANSPWQASYDALWSTTVSLQIGEFQLGSDLGHWVNDGLMTIFFLLVGLEIRREFDLGEFRERRRVAVPVIAAIGGMALPVAIFLALNAGTEGARGWAMVMATDTAFAVGVLALVGRRSSMRLRIFLLTLVIVDDVAAVSVIALFYSSDVQVVALLAAVFFLGAIGWLRWSGVNQPLLYVVLGVAAWLATYQAGVHPTVAGVAIGLLTGAYAPRRSSLQQAISVARTFRQQPSAKTATAAANRITSALSPNDRLQHAIHPWSSYVVVPLFALANAGIDLSGDVIARVMSPISIGIIFGLVVGKTVGIPAGAWLATRPWLGGLRLSVGWPQLIAASSVAGIGFTVSLLIAELSYSDSLLQDAKLGILVASSLAAALSIAMFYGLSRIPVSRLRRAEAHAAEPLVDLVEDVDADLDHIRGAADARVTLLEYADFESARCASAAPLIRSLLDRHEDVRFVFRHLPLPELHPHALPAAEAAEAAGAQGHFWEMHDLLFANHKALLPDDLVRYARQIGLDVERFERDLREGAHAGRVSRDIKSADRAGVVGTPTFFINGVLYRGKRDFEALDAALVRAAHLGEERVSIAREAESNDAATDTADSQSAEPSVNDSEVA
jgi:Na+/H+ antiporter NhaA